MPTKSPEVKATEKKIKEEQRIACETARRERAKQVVAGATFIGDFRVMDPDSESILAVALKNYNGNESNHVTVSDEAVPKHLDDSLAFQAEKLQQYGATVNYMVYGRSVMMTLSTAGKTYFDNKNKAESNMEGEEAQSMRDTIFISHRTVDADVADMIKDFLVATGIPNTKIFCSSLPGNDVHEKISPEVKEHLKNAIINILILSKDYYESAYCLNEAGVAWYLDEAVAIPIGLPEIDHNKMIGFLNSDYILRRLYDDGDVAYLYDQAQEKLNTQTVSHSVITRETQKLKERYTAFINGRVESNIDSEGKFIELPVTDDALLLLLYAAADPGGQLMYVRSLSGGSISANGFGFMQDDSAEEEARWKGAIEELEGKGYVEAVSYKREVFSVTREGFAEAKELKTYRPDIDTTRDPEEYLIDKVETEIVELTRQEMTVLDYLKKHHGDGTGMKETRMSPEVLSICVQSLLAKGKIIEDDSPNGGYKIVE